MCVVTSTANQTFVSMPIDSTTGNDLRMGPRPVEVEPQPPRRTLFANIIDYLHALSAFVGSQTLYPTSSRSVNPLDRRLMLEMQHNQLISLRLEIFESLAEWARSFEQPWEDRHEQLLYMQRSNSFSGLQEGPRSVVRARRSSCK